MGLNEVIEGACCLPDIKLLEFCSESSILVSDQKIYFLVKAKLTDIINFYIYLLEKMGHSKILKHANTNGNTIYMAKTEFVQF